jgi:HdeA/HdeB family
MNLKPAIALLSGLLFACAQPQPQPPPQPQPAPHAAPPPTSATAPAAPAPAGDRFVSILGAKCDTFLRLEADDRGEASMFYTGYTARRFGVKNINVSLIPTFIHRAIDYCQADPNWTVATAFAAAYRDARRW